MSISLETSETSRIEIMIRRADEDSLGLAKLLQHLQESRNIKWIFTKDNSTPSPPTRGLLGQLQAVSDILKLNGLNREGDTLQSVYSLALLPTDFGGLGYTRDIDLLSQQESEVLFLVSAWLESLNSADRSKIPIEPLLSRPAGRRGMTLSEKIFAAHDIDRKGQVKPGDIVRVDVDWIMASELSWSGMERAYDALGKPGIFRNDRFWLAGDHVVDPRINDNPMVKSLVASSTRARDEFRMTEYQGMNYTIMHTEFCRERAQPGMLVIGSDSHTCSAGSMGALAIGLGVADVTMPLITGETWFKIPQSVNIQFINAPGPGIGGKDTILYILKELKRNTVASDRVVEFTGPGLRYLSRDARFAIANMTTEFGGITGIFVPDQVIFDSVNRRKTPRHKQNSYYYRPDEDAEYVETHIIDLAEVESFVARYPFPDDVVPVSQLEGTSLDGCFIGACTTAEEDLILGAMVLEVGLKRGLVPQKHGNRKIVPGSLPILNRLKELGFVAIYEKAGFKVGVPGCSYCVGMGADRAGDSEVWISSQNRNFENRMGKGAIGHLGSAATVAASSFDMKITDPKPFLDGIDLHRLQVLLESSPIEAPQKCPVYIEPGQKNTPFAVPNETGSTFLNECTEENDEHKKVVPVSSDATVLLGLESENSFPKPEKTSSDIFKGKIQRLGDFIDTDALAPAEILTLCKTNEEFGQHCLKHTHPEFRARAKSGDNIVVAGTAFGCGSSRENAVSALLGVGIKCVIAKSFAFIYGRNQPNLGLLGINITDESFYEAAVDGVDIDVDLTGRCVSIAGSQWPFELSDMEIALMEAGGISGAFQKFGKALFETLTAPRGLRTKKRAPTSDTEAEGCGSLQDLQW